MCALTWRARHIMSATLIFYTLKFVKAIGANLELIKYFFITQEKNHKVVSILKNTGEYYFY